MQILIKEVDACNSKKGEKKLKSKGVVNQKQATVSQGESSVKKQDFSRKTFSSNRQKMESDSAEWRKEQAQYMDKNLLSKKEKSELRKVSETMTDFSTQTVCQDKMGGDIMVSNQFLVLMTNEGLEKTTLDNPPMEEDKGEYQSSVERYNESIQESKGEVDYTLKGIRMWAEQEKRNRMQPVEDSG